MKLIAEQPYVKVERQIANTGQYYVEDDRILYLYSDRIVSRYHEFSIENVWDMSYRPVGQKGGLLYLHTSKGVNVYTVNKSPERFIEAFRETIQNQR
ncbi:hypothetical protein [Lentibacillus sp.]|uniref:hypothetical protein n=1 Tax=Lentibacillus sp. TaxID=1925746 RepID=UPI002B4B1899|nr:hypothetical protein [Lentibacillus sp.]HLS10415.1 hypothetical protein [Lentibacillus sp.]